VNDTPANLVGYGVGLICSFMVNSRWTFGHRESLLPVLPQYALVILIAYLANLVCVHWCIKLHLNSYLAQACGVVPYAAISYLLLRRLVFVRAVPNR
jgi:putative flippase GtrA